MRRLLVLLLLVMPGSTDALTTSYTAPQLRAAGVTRIGDILNVFPQFAANTVDGFNWQASAWGVSPWGRDVLDVFVDDALVDARWFDRTALNALPIDISMVRMVRVADADPDRFGRPTIRIYTYASSREQLGSALRLWVGNETGDPGPYRYTSLTSPNVDAQGPDVGYLFRNQSHRWRTTIGLKYAIHYFTDGAQLNRTRMQLSAEPNDTGLFDIGYEPEWPGMRQIGWFVDRRYHSPEGVFGLYAWYGKSRKLYLPIETSGVERAVDPSKLRFGMDFRKPHDSHLDIRGRTEVSRTYVEDAEESNGAGLKWRKLSGVAELAVATEIGRLRLEVEGRGVANFPYYYEADEQFILANADEQREFYERSLAVSSRFNLSWGYVAAYGRSRTLDDSPGSDIGGVAVMRLGEHRLEVGASYRQTPSSETQGIWYWVNRSVAILGNPALDETNRLVSPSTTTALNAQWRLPERLGFNTTLAVAWRNHDGTCYSRHLGYTGEFIQGREVCIATVDSVTTLDSQGNTFVQTVSLRRNIGSFITLSGWFSALQLVDGNAAFDRQWAPLPRKRLRLETTYRPSRRATLSVNAQWQRATHWPEYDPIDGEICFVDGFPVRYDSTVPASTTVNGTASLTWWSNRIATDILAYNLLNETVRYHPMGASFDLKLAVQVRVGSLR